jgi:methyl-accepting chemotaxis protein
MSLKDEITAAVGAHGLWKGKLRDAIQTGKSETTPQGVRVDNQCKFGQWLYGTSMPGAVKVSVNYKECVELHAKFHVAAAIVLELALASQKKEAEAAISSGSEFTTLTNKLTDAMMRWRTSAV